MASKLKDASEEINVDDIPREWVVPQGGKKEMIYESIQNDLDTFKLVERRYLLKWVLFVIGALFAIGGVVIILFSQGSTVLFTRYEKDTTKLVLGLLCFIPIVIWLIFVYCPCSFGSGERNRIIKRHIRKYKAIEKRKFNYTNDIVNEHVEVEDEFIEEPDYEAGVTDRFHKFSNSRGMFFKTELEDVTDRNNGVSNDFYYRTVLYAHMFNKPRNSNARFNKNVRVGPALPNADDAHANHSLYSSQASQALSSVGSSGYKKETDKYAGIHPSRIKHVPAIKGSGGLNYELIEDKKKRIMRERNEALKTIEKLKKQGKLPEKFMVKSKSIGNGIV